VNVKEAELVVVFPASPSRQSLQEFMGRCICYGLDFYFEDGDILPDHVPDNIRGVRAIIIDADDYDKNSDVLGKYENAGARVYVFQRSDKAVVPATPNTWETHARLHALIVDANLTVDSPRIREKLCSRSDDFIFDTLAERMRHTSDLRWYDATRYNWEGLIDCYEITGQAHYLEQVHQQIKRAMLEQDNDCLNCDRVAAFIATLRVYELTRDEEILRYAIEKYERFLELVPRYRGCFTNFTTFAHTARTENIFHVCPGLLRLARITGNKKYADTAMEQLERHIELLLCKKTHLFHHGVGDGGPTAAFWARGVAYCFLGMLMNLEEYGIHDRRHDALQEVFENMAQAIRAHQDSSGFWYSRIDVADSEKEASGTAWITATMERAIRLGYLDESYRACAEAGWQAVKSRVWRGCYPGTTMATTVSKLPSYYCKTPLNTVGWPHFAFRAACERRRSQLQCSAKVSDESSDSTVTV